MDQLKKGEYGASDIIMNCINFTINQIYSWGDKSWQSQVAGTLISNGWFQSLRKSLLTIHMAQGKLEDVQQGGYMM
jgi:hypothetical protein